jgi:predicted acyl esterase
MRRRNVIKGVGAGIGGSLVGFAGATRDADAVDVGEYLPYADHEHPANTDDFEERDWGYVLKEFTPPAGTDNAAIFSMRGYQGASRAGRPTHYVRMRDDALVAVNLNSPDPGFDGAYPVPARASLRGTACSGGTFTLFDDTHRRDGYELIEWLADRPYTLDRVGMYGSSYGALTALLVAATQPPSLATLMAHKTWGDLYRGFAHPGGIPQLKFTKTFAEGFRPDFAEAGKSSSVEAGDELCAEIGGGAGRYDEQERVVDIVSSRPLDGMEYSARSQLTQIHRINVPTYIGHAFQDELTGPRGGPEVFRALDPDPVDPDDFPGRTPPTPELREEPKMLRMTNGGHATADIFAHGQDVTRWFNYWLRGEDTGIQTEKPVKILFGTESRDSGFETRGSLSLDAFPAPETDWERYYFRENNGLSTLPPTSSKTASQYTYDIPEDWFLGGDLTGRDDLVTFSTDRFERPRVIAGPMTVTLYAAVTDTDEDPTDTDFFVSISDVDPDGAQRTYLQKGMLRASHRALDESRTLHNENGDIIRPYHPHTNPVDIHAETIYQFDIEVFSLGHLLYPGHRIAVNVHAPPENDYEYLDTGWQMGYEGLDTENTTRIHHDADHPSNILVPLRDWPANKDLPAEPDCGDPDLYKCVMVS